MSPFVLQVKYRLSKTTAQMLVKERSRDLDEFYNMFTLSDRYIEDPFMNGLSYSSNIKITIKTTINKSTTSLTEVVDLKNYTTLYLE
jgi:hypothetical protein